MPAGQPSDFTPSAPAPPPEDVQPPDPMLTMSVEELQRAGVLSSGSFGLLVEPDDDEAPVGEPAPVLTLPPPPPPPPPPRIMVEDGHTLERVAADLPDDDELELPPVSLCVRKGWVRAAIGDGPTVAWRADQIVGLVVLEQDEPVAWALGVVIPSGEVQLAGRWGTQAEAETALVMLSIFLGDGPDAEGTVSPG